MVARKSVKDQSSPSSMDGTGLLSHYYINKVEAGCDEAGRGCLAGPVYAGAVILPPDYHNDLLNDSKQLTEKKRYQLREIIERDALAWAVGVVTNEEIDRINILRASILAMQRAVDALKLRPEALIIDGNRFNPYYPPLSPTSLPQPGCAAGAFYPAQEEIEAFGQAERSKQALPHTTIVKGDGKYLAIAAASILAKTYRDDFMMQIHEQYPEYRWDSNKGYPAKVHRDAIREYGPTPYHRMSFQLLPVETQLEFDF